MYSSSWHRLASRKISMVFSGIPFIYYFLPCVLILYFVLPEKCRNYLLVIASLCFYGWGEQKLTLLFSLTILCGYILGLLIHKYKNTGLSRLLLALGVVIFLSILGYYKYADFFIVNINRATGLSIPLLRVAMPIGISFYTFQLISYLVDIYWGKYAPQKNIVKLFLYISFFPQLIAGPIVRYSLIEQELNSRKIKLEDCAYGFRRFVIGLSKKVIIANTLGELCSSYKSAASPDVLWTWLYAVSFLLQIYYDFSGYSDMAIGLGRIFGFHFLENFDYPYVSRSITEFWRRWHISLGSWFRDYVYIPLGGNRRGIVRQIINILIVWMLTGMWHGASWNFVLWGVYFGIILIIEKFFLLKRLNGSKVLSHVYVLLICMMGFVLFNGESLSGTLLDLGRFIGFGGSKLITPMSLYYLRSYGFCILLGVVGATPIVKKTYHKLQTAGDIEKVLTVAEPLTLIILVVLVTANLVDGSFNPFLYFRF